MRRDAGNHQVTSTSTHDPGWGVTRKTVKQRLAGLMTREQRKLFRMSSVAARSAALPPYMSTKQVAAYTGLSISFFEASRLRGDGPPYIRMGRRVLYKLDSLLKWIDSRERV